MSNTPFRRHKIWVHEGGISTPCIHSLPRVNRRDQPGGSVDAPQGELRHTPAHIIDFVPTVLELAGVAPPERWNDLPRPSMPGKSLAPLFDRDAEITRDYLYWNHSDNHALRIGDWKIVAEKERNETWELYNLKTDRIESHDLSAEEPGRRDEMAAEWKRIDAQYRKDGGVAGARRAAKAISPAR